MHLTSCRHGDQSFLQQQTECKIVTGRGRWELKQGKLLGLLHVWQVSSTRTKGRRELETEVNYCLINLIRLLDS